MGQQKFSKFLIFINALHEFVVKLNSYFCFFKFLVHIADMLEHYGPIWRRSMYPEEREIGRVKNSIKNFSKQEISAAKNYVRKRTIIRHNKELKISGKQQKYLFGQDLTTKFDLYNDFPEFLVWDGSYNLMKHLIDSGFSRSLRTKEWNFVETRT